jgi:hypothetical protein
MTDTQYIDTITGKPCTVRDTVNEMGITMLVISFEDGATARRRVSEIKANKEKE